jgi:NitT/TauT family transport system substrate-binding protein/putative hydroxymethylpyrimidine transport system substrate-binding protein
VTTASLRRPALAVLAVLVAALLALGLAACGDDDDDGSDAGATTAASGAALPSPTGATLVLDFLPGGVHAGIYRAEAQGYYEANNVNLRIIEPTSTADTLKLIDAGQADFGIADGIDLANQISEGRSAKAIGAVVQVPLGGLITLEEKGITDPKQLEGKTIGVTGVPSDNAIYQTIMKDAGGDPEKAKVVTIGFNGVQNLETGKVDAFTGFWTADGVQVQEDGYPTTIFRLDENGGPTYPGLVFFSTEEKIASDPDLMRAFMDATVRGYQETIADPAASVDDMLAEVPTLERPLTEAVVDTYVPLFQADAPAYGVLQTDDLEALSTFLVDNGLIKEAIPPERYGTNEFLPATE